MMELFDPTYEARKAAAECKAMALCAENGWLYAFVTDNLKEFHYAIPGVDSMEPFYHAVPE